MECAAVRAVTLAVTLGGRIAAMLGVATALALLMTHSELGAGLLTPVLDLRPQIHSAGVVLIGAGLVWAVAILIEYRFSLKPPNHGTLYAIDQGLFFVAQLGYVTGIAGLMWARAAGDGWFGKAALGLFGFGWIVLVVAQPLAWLTRNNNLPLFPLGGLAAMLGGLLAGVAVVVARRWTGWQRFSVLIYSLYYLLALLLPLLIANHGPTLVTEFLWGMAWLPIGIALVSHARRRARKVTPANANSAE